MHIALINSKQDSAGVNIRTHIFALLGCRDDGGRRSFSCGGHTLDFIELDGRLIQENNLDARVGSDLIIFLSRHTSRNPVPALTVHVTGNYGNTAALGGEPHTLAQAAPGWMHAVLCNLSSSAPEGYRVSYEVTHHGPTDMNTPSFFVEIGSTETEWTDEAAGAAVAASVLDAIKSGPRATVNLIGFGGNHYAARQTDIALDTRAAWGHIAHSREVPGIDAGMVEQMRQKSSAVAAYIDRKSLPGAEIKRIEKLISECGLPCLSESELRSLGGIEWESYCRVRRLCRETAPESRCYLHRMEGRGDPVSFEIQPDLLEEALRIGKARFMESLDKLPVVHLSSRGGLPLPIFISYDENRLKLIHDLITSCVVIIISDLNTVADGNRLIIRRVRFDPKKALNRGVPQGPLFGRLASGKVVEVNGDIITPEMVSACSERIIHVPGLERFI